MITARLRIPRPDGRVEEAVLELPDGGKLDGLDLLDRFVARFGSGRGETPQTASTPAEAGLGRVAGLEPAPTTSKAGDHPKPAPMLAGVRDTSLAAYHDLVASGRLSRQQRALVEFLRAHPGRDWTRAELAEGMGWRINVVTGRIKELLSPPFDVVEELPRRECRFTKESAHALRLR